MRAALVSVYRAYSYTGVYTLNVEPTHHCARKRQSKKSDYHILLDIHRYWSNAPQRKRYA